MMSGRNDPCPCGSGKKYKRCCALADEAARSQDLAGAPGAGPMPPLSSPNTWKSWGVSGEAAAAFFHAAAAFFRARPWEALADDELLYADLPAGRT